MYRKLIRKCCFSLIALPLSAHALASYDSLPDHLPALNANYSGKLNYIDYGSGNSVAIPLSIQFLTSKDGKFLIVDRVYTDPGYQVFSLSVMSYAKDSQQWTDNVFEGGEYSSSFHEIVEFSVIDAQHWKVVRTIRKQDNNRDAMLTITDHFDGTQFNGETRVDYLDTDENENLRRNWIELTLD